MTDTAPNGDQDRITTTAAGWVKIDCVDREALVCRNGERYDGFKVAAARTDMDGQFGEPTIFTEWYDSLTGSEESVLRDYRYPGRRTPDDPYPDDARPCEHYRLVSRETVTVPLDRHTHANARWAAGWAAETVRKAMADPTMLNRMPTDV